MRASCMVHAGRPSGQVASAAWLLSLPITFFMDHHYSSAPPVAEGRSPVPRRAGADRLTWLWSRIFNLNDPRWGRNDDEPAARPGAEQDTGNEKPSPPDQRPERPTSSDQRKPDQGPPDLDELWRDLNRKIAGLFGNDKPPSGWGDSSGQPPDGKGTGIGVGIIAAAALIVWLLSGFFIVQEGQQSVVTRFGKYQSTVGAGINWTFPYPIERHETVNVTQIRSVDIGGDAIIKSTGLRDSAMLTADENIVEIKFAVQYRLSNARDYLFASRNPDQAVIQAAETAVREVIGAMRMDAALAEERDQIGTRVRKLMQSILDRYQFGIDIVSVNLQQGGVRPPEQVQAAFDDVLKAGQERERAKNEAQAYANRVIPQAVGKASRLRADAEGYKARIVAQAKGDAERFSSILPEYQKAPQATRDRMYNDTMQQVYGSVTKILVDARQGSALYLPLDKILQAGTAAAGGSGNAARPAAESPAAAASSAGSVPSATGNAAANAANQARSRDPATARDRNAP